MPAPIFLPDPQFDAFGVLSCPLAKLMTSEASFLGRPHFSSRLGATNGGVYVDRAGIGVIKAVRWQLGWLVLKANGSVLAFNSVTTGEGEPTLRADLPAGFQSDVVDIDASQYYAVAVKSDGTLAEWMASPISMQVAMPSEGGFVRVSVMSGDKGQSFAIKSDGTIKAWGGVNIGQPSLTNIIKISGANFGGAGLSFFWVALRSDGKLIPNQLRWGLDGVPFEENVVDVFTAPYYGYAGAVGHYYAIHDDGKVSSNDGSTGGAWRDFTDIVSGGTLAGGLHFMRSDGSVIDQNGTVKLTGIDRMYGGGGFVRRDGSLPLYDGQFRRVPQSLRPSVNSLGDNVFSVVYDGSEKSVTPNYETPLGRNVISVAYSPSPARNVGTYALTYSVSDISYKTALADAVGSLVITPGAPIITAGQTLSGKVGSFSVTPALTDAANRPATSWEATGLPSWATLNATTGAITGTPQDSGSTTISLTATGPGGTSAAATATISIAIGAPSITAGQSFTGKVGVAFSATPTLDDALDRPATSWSATGLPAGLSLNATTGAITGTPTAKGSFTASFTATGGGGTGTATSIAFTITDGVPQIGGLIGNWGEVVLPAQVNWSAAAYGNGRFVCVASNSANAAYSSDGRSWTQVALPSVQAWTSVTYGMAYDPFGGTRAGRFVAVGGSVAAYSDDGVVWTQAALPSNRQWYVTYGTRDMVITSPDRYVAVGWNSNAVAHSHDGVTWTAATLPLTRQWDSVAFGNGRFVAVSATNGTFAYSSNGQTWTTGSMPSVQTWNGLAYGNGVFVCIASGSNAVAYGNGVTWGQAILPSSQQWSAVAYDGGVFVAVALSSGVSAYSSNGIDWVQSNLPASRTWSSVVGGGGRFVAIASGHSFAALMEPRRGQVGVPFASSFFAVDTTNRPVTSWAATGLPAWLSINATTGAITGAPTNTGSTTISLTATGPGGTSATLTETISVVTVSDFSAEILCICEVSATLFEGILLASSFSAEGTAQMQIVGPLSLSVQMSAVGGLSVGGSWYFYGDVLGSFVAATAFEASLRLLDLKRFVCGEFEMLSGSGKAMVFCYTTVNGRITLQPLVNVGLRFFQNKTDALAYRDMFDAPRQFDYVSVADGRSVIEGEVNVLAPWGVYNIWAVSEPPPGDVRVHFSVNLQRA